MKTLTTHTKKLRTSHKTLGRSHRVFAYLLIAVLLLTFASPAFAAMDDPEQVITKFGKFIFGIVHAIGAICVVFGLVQIGFSFSSHDPSQRANGFLILAGGVIIAFAPEILKIIAPNAMARFN